MADSNGLTSSSGSGCRSWFSYIARSDSTGKPAANLLGRIQLTAGKRTREGDASARVVRWSFFGLK